MAGADNAPVRHVGERAAQIARERGLLGRGRSDGAVHDDDPEGDERGRSQATQAAGPEGTERDAAFCSSSTSSRVVIRNPDSTKNMGSARNPPFAHGKPPWKNSIGMRARPRRPSRPGWCRIDACWRAARGAGDATVPVDSVIAMVVRRPAATARPASAARPGRADCRATTTRRPRRRRRAEVPSTLTPMSFASMMATLTPSAVASADATPSGSFGPILAWPSYGGIVPRVGPSMARTAGPATR